jgi:cytochrome c biogenesis protein CcmG, thiol:disulfide interchange protein DsbE
MNYPVAIGDAKLAEQYGGVLGLPVSFLIGRDGRIYAKYVGETDISLIEREIKSLL